MTASSPSVECYHVRRHHIGIRSQESFPVEVDQVVWGFGDPDFGFPGDVRKEAAEGFYPEIATAASVVGRFASVTDTSKLGKRFNS